jgi:hypothetical protein
MTPMVGTPLVEYVLVFFLPRSPTYMSISQSAFQNSRGHPPTPLPCFYPHSMGRNGPGACWGPISSPGLSPRVTDLGCWVLPSGVRSLKDHSTLRSHPNKAVDVVPTKLFRSLFAGERSTYVDSLVFPSSSAWLSRFGGFAFFLCSGSLRQPPVRSRPAGHDVTAHRLLR